MVTEGKCCIKILLKNFSVNQKTGEGGKKKHIKITEVVYHAPWTYSAEMLSQVFWRFDAEAKVA